MTTAREPRPRLTLQTKLWRAWLVATFVWVIGAAGYVYANWDDIYPERPAYLIALDDAGEKLVVWYASEAGQTVESFVRERGLGQVEQTPIGANTLVLPARLEQAKRQDLIERARRMEIYLDERYLRGIYFRFIPIVLLLIFGPPLVLFLLARSFRAFMVRWLQD